MNRFTPGPWKAVFETRKDGSGGSWWVRGDHGFFSISIIGQKEQDHNARLIAAAPELLEALQNIAKKVPHHVSREEAADMACEFVLIARAAVARATGGSGE